MFAWHLPLTQMEPAAQSPELVQVVPGPNPQNLVAYLKRPLENG